VSRSVLTRRRCTWRWRWPPSSSWCDLRAAGPAFWPGTSRSGSASTCRRDPSPLRRRPRPGDRQHGRSADAELERALREEQIGAASVERKGVPSTCSSPTRTSARRSRAGEGPLPEPGRGARARRRGGRPRLHPRVARGAAPARQRAEQALKIIRNRIDQFGVAEPTVQAQGSDEIVVQLPGIQDRSAPRS